MAKTTNLDRLAQLIRAVAGSEEGKTSEETIRLAVKQLKKVKKLDIELDKKLKKAHLIESVWEYDLSAVDELPQEIEKAIDALLSTTPSETEYEQSANVIIPITFDETPVDSEGNPVEVPDVLELNDAEVEDFVSSLDDEELFGLSMIDIKDQDEFFDDIEEDDTMDAPEPEPVEGAITEAVKPHLFTKSELLQKARNMIRYRSKIKMGMKRAMKRHANMGTLMQRAKAKAKRDLRKKYLNGRSWSELSPSEKYRITKMIWNKVTVAAKRLLPTERKLDAQRNH